MPSWGQILSELQSLSSPLDVVRRKYLAHMQEVTGRNVIAYYSGFLQRSTSGVSISDLDTNGLMNAVHGLDRNQGLDLLLHTPGGDLCATEAIVRYLREVFGNNIRCFVPQIAMSAGTMIACACKEIYMGRQSSLGPIDPQFGGIPAHGVIEEFRRAVKDVKTNPASIPIWQPIIGRYHPTFIGECEKAIQLSGALAKSWLKTGMFSGEPSATTSAVRIVKSLNNHRDTKMHARHISADEALRVGLKVRMLEEDNALQDTVLTIHHSYMHTFSNSDCEKIIENHKGAAIITHAGKAS